MKTCSSDLRERIVAARDEGYSAAEVGQRFKVSKRSVERYWKQYQQSGHILPKQRGGYKKSRLAGHDDKLKQWIADQPDLTLEELKGLCADQLGVKIGLNALWQRLDKLGLSFKKTLHASEQERADVIAKRRWWRQQQARWNPQRLVFVDETGLNTTMTRRYGRAMRSRRCLGFAPHGHWHTSTFIAALRLDRLEAPWLLDGPMNGSAFLLYLERILIPTLQPGDMVICDNLSSHKNAAVRDRLEAAGASLHYLPPYSPDLNPIEMAFAKLKAMLRKTAARSFDTILQAVAEAIKQYPKKQCKAFFRHAKYATK